MFTTSHNIFICIYMHILHKCTIIKYLKFFTFTNEFNNFIKLIAIL